MVVRIREPAEVPPKANQFPRYEDEQGDDSAQQFDKEVCEGLAHACHALSLLGEAQGLIDSTGMLVLAYHEPGQVLDGKLFTSKLYSYFCSIDFHSHAPKIYQPDTLKLRSFGEATW